MKFALENNPDASIRALSTIVERLVDKPEWVEEGNIPEIKTPIDEVKNNTIKTNDNITRSYCKVDDLFGRINAKNILAKGYTGKDINVAIIDYEIDFNDARLKDKKLKIIKPGFQQWSQVDDHGTGVALILAGNKDSGGVGISPGVKVASYSNEVPVYESIKNAREDLKVRIANLSVIGITPQALHFGQRFMGDKVDKGIADTAIVVIAGNS